MMKQQLSQAKQRADLSKTTYEKRKRLWDQKIGSEIDYLQAETQYSSDKEMVTQMEKQLAKSTVKAPFAGQIDETMADEGQLVVPGTTALFLNQRLSRRQNSGFPVGMKLCRFTAFPCWSAQIYPT